MKQILALAVIALTALWVVSCEEDVGSSPPVYTVTIKQPANGGTISASPVNGQSGTTVSLTNSPAENYTFSHYTVDGEAVNGATFTLTKNVTISGEFTYNAPIYTVTVNQPANGGSIGANPVSGQSGTIITLTNSPAEDYAFSHYIVDGEAIDRDTFTLTKDLIVRGEFTYTGTEAAYTVTVNQPASGGSIDASPASGPAGTVITLTNSPAKDYTFSHYIVDGEAIDSDTFTLTKDSTVSGEFTYNEPIYTVTVNQPANGGSIGASPVSGQSGTTVSLTNSPATGYTFSHYTVDGEAIDGDTFTLTKDSIVSGEFTYNEPIYTVTVNQPASGGSIGASPVSGQSGTTVSLTNSPATGYTFSHYTVDGEAIDGDTFTLTKDSTVSGEFTYNEPIYTVTVNQPASGGSIGASPVSGQSGTIITLTNSPAEDYEFSHYIVDGETVNGAVFTLNKDVTVSGAFNYGEEMRLGEGGPLARLVVPATAGEDAVLEVSGTAAEYRGVRVASLNGVITADLSGRAVQVRLSAESPAEISLAYVHYIRAALKGKGGTGVSVTETTAFTPVFSSGEWIKGSARYNLIIQNLYDNYKVENKFTESGVEVMSGIKIARDGADDKCKVVYSRDIKVLDLSYIADYTDSQWPVNGIDLKKGGSGNIIPETSIKIHEGKWNETSYGTVSFSTFTEYAELLRSIGAYPAQGNAMRPDNGSVQIVSAGADANIMSNGIYDFILCYYNPSGAGAAGADEEGRALLPEWGVYGQFSAVLDGVGAPPAGVVSRDIGGVVSADRNRKGASRTTGAPSSYGTGGEPRADFINNITVPMANYLVSAVHVPEFKNTNIIGNGDKWYAWDGSSGKISDTRVILMPTSNVGLIGSYNNITTEGSFYGVTDLVSATPMGIGHHLIDKTGYLNLWNNVPREIRVSGFFVANIKGSGGNYIVGGVSTPETIPNVIIFSKKYTNALSSGAEYYQPFYRAFVDSSGKVKLTGAGSDFDAKYLGFDSTKPIPAFDEEAWLTAANNGTTPPDLAPNYASLDPEYKWNNQADLDLDSE
jgi:hypothetical protein